MRAGAPSFEYTGRDGIGSLVRGILQADDEARARARLREQGLFVTSLRPRPARASLPWGSRRLGPEEVSAFTFHLAGLVGSGIPLPRALEVLREQADTQPMRQIIADLEGGIQAGQTFSGALGQHPTVFSALFTGVIKIGEVAGAMDAALARLADYLEREVALQQKVRTMLIYPAFVIALAAVVAAALLTFVVPVFDRVYRSAGATLPLPTQTLVTASRVMRQQWPVLIGVLGVGVWLVRRGRVGAELRDAAGRALARIPRAGALARLVQVTRFVRAFSTMQASGVPVMSALNVVLAATPDRQMRAAVAHLREAIDGGQRLSEALRALSIFPPLVHRMVAMGEETGRLDVMLTQTAELLERETDFAIKRLMTLAEPVLTLGLGAAVGGILLALYLPIFSLPKLLLR